jgi:hypothetical protein
MRLRVVALTPSRARLSRDFGERWCLLLEEAEEGGGDGSRKSEVEEDTEASREEEDLEEGEDLRDDEDKADESQLQAEVVRWMRTATLVCRSQEQQCDWRTQVGRTEGQEDAGVLVVCQYVRLVYS